MCLAVPGKIENITGSGLDRQGKVSFGGILKDINLAYVPDAKAGDYIVAHVGFALDILDTVEAKKLIEDIKKIEQNGEEEAKQGNYDEIP